MDFFPHSRMLFATGFRRFNIRNSSACWGSVMDRLSIARNWKAPALRNSTIDQAQSIIVNADSKTLMLAQGPIMIISHSRILRSLFSTCFKIHSKPGNPPDPIYISICLYIYTHIYIYTRRRPRALWIRVITYNMSGGGSRRVTVAMEHVLVDWKLAPAYIWVVALLPIFRL